MLFQKPARVLSENQIEFDILSADMLTQSRTVGGGQIVVNGQKFCSLIVPYAQRLPEKLIKSLVRLGENGLNILFIDELPEALSEKGGDIGLLNKLHSVSRVCTLQELPEKLEGETDRLITDREVPYLRYYHYFHEDGEIFLLFNEDLYENLNIHVTFPTDQPLHGYAPMENRRVDLPREGEGYSITLAKGELMVLYTNTAEEKETKVGNVLSQAAVFEAVNAFSLKNQHWTVEVGKGLGGPKQQIWEFDSLPDLDRISELEDFSGELIYRTEFSSCLEQMSLVIEEVNEIAEVHLNGISVGRRISYPYAFDLTGYSIGGKNVLEIRVVNNLGRYRKDYLSQFIVMEPLGITGDVVLYSRRNDLIEEG